MQFLNVLALATAVSATALKSGRMSARLESRASTDLCPPLDSPECCQIDVDGVADLSCAAPTGEPKTAADFEKSCSETGRSAMCCTVVIGTDSLLCQEA